MTSIPITYTETLDWLNAGTLFHMANGNERKWLGVELNQEVLCQHHNTTSERAYPDDMYTDMTRINCADCGEVVGYDN